MPRYVNARIFLAITLALQAGACSGSVTGPVSLDQDSWELLLELPDEPILEFQQAPDGSLFAAVSTGLYRALPSDYGRWTRISELEGFPIALRAVSKSRVFGLYRGSRVFRWDEQDGIGDLLPGTVLDSLLSSLEITSFFSLVSLADGLAAGDEDIVVVGDEALVLAFDGNAWRPESTPLDTLGQPVLWSIDGDATLLYAVSLGTLLERTAAGWELVPVPPAIGESCLLTAVVSTARQLLVGGGSPPCLFRRQASGWESLERDLRHLTVGSLFKGAGAPGGDALFWTIEGDVVLVQDPVVRLFQLPRQGFAGATVILDDLYFSGSLRGQGYVARIALSSF